MSLTISVKDSDSKDFNATLATIPDCCPICRAHGQPNFLNACVRLVSAKVPLMAAFRCPVINCRSIFIANYQLQSSTGPTYGLNKTSLNQLIEAHEFPDNIKTVSTLFCTTYNQTKTAEENGLDQICGPGYRKALEFLVKDYLSSHVYKDDIEKQEQVKKAFLGNVIKDHVDEKRIKQCAARAVWLGNDETHYTRKWENKDISDLKSLILMTVNFIDMTIEADRYLSEMPESGKPPEKIEPVPQTDPPAS